MFANILEKGSKTFVSLASYKITYFSLKNSKKLRLLIIAKIQENFNLFK